MPGLQGEPNVPGLWEAECLRRLMGMMRLIAALHAVVQFLGFGCGSTPRRMNATTTSDGLVHMCLAMIRGIHRVGWEQRHHDPPR
jgi:hypothetical protein